jgi:hypothetical protein
VGLGPAVAVMVGVEEGVRIGVALGGWVAVGGLVGAAVSVAATMVSIRSADGIAAVRVHDPVMKAVVNTITSMTGRFIP